MKLAVLDKGDVFDSVSLDAFDGLDVFDLIEEVKRLRSYVAPPKVSVSLSDEIRELIKIQVAESIKEAVADAVKGIKPRTIETKTVERVVEKKIPTPEKVIIKEKYDDAPLIKKIEAKIKKAMDEAPLFIPAPTLIPSQSGQSGKVLSTDGNQPKWVAASSGGASSDAYTVSNVTTDREFDAIDTTVDELANVLGSLITSLKGAGIIQ